MTREIAIGDVHGMSNQLKKLVEDVIAFNPAEDRLIFLGDYIDRGKDSKEVIEYVSALKANHPDSVELLMGNHEAMCQDAMLEGAGSSEDVLWRMNGGREVLSQFANRTEAKRFLLPFIAQLKPYLETEQAIYVHGGIPRRKTLITASIEELLWDRNFAYMGSKLLVCGHTPHVEVTHYGNIVCVDAGCFLSGTLSSYDVITGTVFSAYGQPAIPNPEAYKGYLKYAPTLSLMR